MHYRQHDHSLAHSLTHSLTQSFKFTFLPLVVLVVFNALLVRVVIGAARQRQAMTSAVTPEMTSGSSGDQQRITVMLICVVIVFIVCQVRARTSGLYSALYRQSYIRLLAAETQAVNKKKKN